MNEKAILYAIFFLFMIIMNRFLSGRLLREIYDSAGLTLEDIYKKRLELRHRKHASRYLSKWVLSVSPNPKRTGKLFKVYYLLTMPSVICLGVSVTGIFTHIFDRFLDFATMVVLALLISSAFASIFIFKEKR